MKKEVKKLFKEFKKIRGFKVSSSYDLFTATNKELDFTAFIDDEGDYRFILQVKTDDGEDYYVGLTITENLVGNVIPMIKKELISRLKNLEV